MNDKDLSVARSILALLVTALEHPVAVRAHVCPEAGKVFGDHMKSVAGVIVGNLAAILARQRLHLKRNNSVS